MNQQAEQPRPQPSSSTNAALSIGCFNCGYNLTGLQSAGVCPECQFPVARSTHAAASRNTWLAEAKPRLLAGITLLSIAVFAIMVLHAHEVSVRITPTRVSGFERFIPRAMLAYMFNFLTPASLYCLATGFVIRTWGVALAGQRKSIDSPRINLLRLLRWFAVALFVSHVAYTWFFDFYLKNLYAANPANPGGIFTTAYKFHTPLHLVLSVSTFGAVACAVFLIARIPFPTKPPRSARLLPVLAVVNMIPPTAIATLILLMRADAINGSSLVHFGWIRLTGVILLVLLFVALVVVLVRLNRLKPHHSAPLT